MLNTTKKPNDLTCHFHRSVYIGFSVVDLLIRIMSSVLVETLFPWRRQWTNPLIN